MACVAILPLWILPPVWSMCRALFLVCNTGDNLLCHLGFLSNKVTFTHAFLIFKHYPNLICSCWIFDTQIYFFLYFFFSFCYLIWETERQTWRDLYLPVYFLDTHNRWDEARVKPGPGAHFLSHVRNRDEGTWVCMLTKGWNWEWTWSMILGTPVWDAGIPRNILIVIPNACLHLLL